MNFCKKLHFYDLVWAKNRWGFDHLLGLFGPNSKSWEGSGTPHLAIWRAVLAKPPPRGGFMPWDCNPLVKQAKTDPFWGPWTPVWGSKGGFWNPKSPKVGVFTPLELRFRGSKNCKFIEKTT